MIQSVTTSFLIYKILQRYRTHVLWLKPYSVLNILCDLQMQFNCTVFCFPLFYVQKMCVSEQNPHIHYCLCRAFSFDQCMTNSNVNMQKWKQVGFSVCIQKPCFTAFFTISYTASVAASHQYAKINGNRQAMSRNATSTSPCFPLLCFVAHYLA